MIIFWFIDWAILEILADTSRIWHALSVASRRY